VKKKKMAVRKSSIFHKRHEERAKTYLKEAEKHIKTMRISLTCL